MGSAGLDLSASTSTILTSDMPPVKMPTGIKGPLPVGIVSLIIGRCSTSMQRINVIPGVINSDFMGEIQIMLLAPTKTIQIMKGQRIVQLLLLLYKTMGKMVSTEPRGVAEVRSSNTAFMIQEISAKRTLHTILVQGVPIQGQGVPIQGLLDTGADVSCIAGKDWPSSWPTHQA